MSHKAGMTILFWHNGNKEQRYFAEAVAAKIVRYLPGDETFTTLVDRQGRTICGVLNDSVIAIANHNEDVMDDRKTRAEEARQASFEVAVRPLIKWLCDNSHPHSTIIVTPTSAELLESSMTTGTVMDYVKD